MTLKLRRFQKQIRPEKAPRAINFYALGLFLLTLAVSIFLNVGLSSPSVRRSYSKPKPLDLSRFTSLVKALQNEQEMLEKYYNNSRDNIIKGFYNDKYDVMVEKLSDRLGYSIVNHGKIIIGCVGSSVMAGHDNCHYDSFPSQLQRTLDGVLNDSPITAEVRNAGITGVCGDNFQNRLWCNNALVGDADMVISSWSFFGMNSWANRGYVNAWARWTIKSGALPYVLFPGTGGSYEIVAIQGSLEEYGFSYFFPHKIGGIFGGNLGWGGVGDGLHNTTRYAWNESEARVKSLGVMNRNWHPGPLAFQYASDVMFFLIADAIKLALKNVEKDKSFFQTPIIQKLNATGPSFLEVHGPFNGTNIPFCLIGEEPVYGTSKIKILKNDEVSPKFRGEEWERWFGAYERKIPGLEREDPRCLHIDRCGGWAGKDGAWISFEIPQLTKGVLAVCGNDLENVDIFVNEGETSVGPNFLPGMNGKCKHVKTVPEVVTKSHFQLHIRASPSGRFDDIIAA